MALNSLEIASDGLIRTGGFNTLTMTAQGILRVVAAGAAVTQELFIANVGSMMKQ